MGGSQLVELVCIIIQHHTKSSRAVEQWLATTFTIIYALEWVCNLTHSVVSKVSVPFSPSLAIPPGGDGWSWGSLASATWRKDAGPRASCQGPVYTIPSGKLGLYWRCLCKVRFSPISKKPVSVTPAQKAVAVSGSLPVTPSVKHWEHISGTHRLGSFCRWLRPPHGWMFNQGPLSKASGRLELLLEKLERT